MVDWSYYYDNRRFDAVNDKYLPDMGEGETKATQICTAVNKLVYKWYNDGDVYDNQHYLSGWCNDLSSYANWLRANTTPEAAGILDCIADCRNGDDYGDLLKRLADKLLDEAYLDRESKNPTVGSIYDCEGPFVFREEEEKEDDEEDDEEWEDEDE